MRFLEAQVGKKYPDKNQSEQKMSTLDVIEQTGPELYFKCFFFYSKLLREIIIKWHGCCKLNSASSAESR